MEFNWITFLLEIINFLVLVWLLKRFFYRPVLNVIEERQKNVKDSLSEVSQARQEVDQLKQQYTNRLNDWEKEKENKYQELQLELNKERDKQLSLLEQELEQNREKTRFRLKQQGESLQKEADEQAINNAVIFVKQLLVDFAGPELSLRLLQYMMMDLKQLPEGKIKQLRHTWQSPGSSVKVVSAYDLDAAHRRELEAAFTALFGENAIEWTYAVEKDLIAGARVQIGPWMLRASVLDEFEFFKDIAHEAG